MHPVGLVFLQALAFLIAGAALLWLLTAPRTFLLKLRCGRALRSWLEKNGFEIVVEERRRFSQGPFVCGPKEDYAVTRLELRDRDGRIRKGFVRCGDHARGFLGRHEVAVCWDAADDPVRSVAARLWLWIGLPFVSFTCVMAAYAYWFASGEFKPILYKPYVAPILIAGLVLLGIMVMVLERKQGFPTLRRVVAVDSATFQRLFLSHALACLGGFFLAGAVLMIPRMKSDGEAFAGLILAVGGLSMLAFGVRRAAALLKRLSGP